eukprot:COSAG02_NODE_1189_length_13995_cov_7.850101_3_plen_129_part_00
MIMPAVPFVGSIAESGRAPAASTAYIEYTTTHYTRARVQCSVHRLYRDIVYTRNCRSTHGTHVVGCEKIRLATHHAACQWRHLAKSSHCRWPKLENAGTTPCMLLLCHASMHRARRPAEDACMRVHDH